MKAALSAMTVKTDRKDARGLAQLMRMGWFRPVHAKSIGSQEVRALLVARKQLLERLIDVELSIRGILRNFGLKVGQVTRKNFDVRIRELVMGQATLERIVGAMLSARTSLKAEYEKLHKAVLAIVREDAVCRRPMTVPSVGPLVAITYKSAMDDPNRIAKSKAAGALFGLTPKKYQSGEKDITGGITRAGAFDLDSGKFAAKESQSALRPSAIVLIRFSSASSRPHSLPPVGSPSNAASRAARLALTKRNMNTSR